MPTNARPTQEARVLAVLIEAKGAWVSGQFFLREMFLSQYHRAIFNLEHRDGVRIEHSTDTDDLGFKRYRIVSPATAPVASLPPVPQFQPQCQLFSTKAPAT